MFLNWMTSSSLSSSSASSTRFFSTATTRATSWAVAAAFVPQPGGVSVPPRSLRRRGGFLRTSEDEERQYRYYNTCNRQCSQQRHYSSFSAMPNNNNSSSSSSSSSSGDSGGNISIRNSNKGSNKRPYHSRKQEAKRLGKSQKELSWEHYDFSLSPKQDNRFGNGRNVIATGEFANVDADKEAEKDHALAQKINLSHDAFLKLDSETVRRATEILESFINPDRLERVSSVLRQRTKRSKFLFENPSNPSNVWACLRTIDSFGIQNVDVAIDPGMYSGKQALNQKRGMRTAMGSAQWLTLTVHGSCRDAVHQIKNVQGYKIYASDLNPKSKDVRDVDWDAGPICVVMGNEDRGISDEMRELADETFVLPMCGFAESFNLSVATSITLAHMSSKSFNGNGPLRPGDLEEHEYNCLYLKDRKSVV